MIKRKKNNFIKFLKEKAEEDGLSEQAFASYGDFKWELNQTATHKILD